MRLRGLTVAGLVVLTIAGCGSDGSSKSHSSPKTTESKSAEIKPTGALARKPKVQVPSGPAPKRLQQKDLIVGKGPAAKAGSVLRVQYVGVRFRDGKEFDSSWKRNQPFEFQLGARMVIPGWDSGLAGMRVGGRRRLVIPPRLAYGRQGAPPDIGPNETLVFVIDLVGIR